MTITIDLLTFVNIIRGKMLPYGLNKDCEEFQTISTEALIIFYRFPLQNKNVNLVINKLC